MLRNYASENELDFVVGMDEVGRGSFAGPVVVAAVVLPRGFESELIVDSKLICKSKPKMQKAYDLIIKNAINISCVAISAKDINVLGIEDSIWKAMSQCIDESRVPIDHVLVDGTRYKTEHTNPYTTVVKGDNTFLSIAAAAIVAKYRRDEYMVKVHKIHPQYNFKGSKGYYCKKHGEGLIEHGMTSYHRTQYVNTWTKNKGITLPNG